MISEKKFNKKKEKKEKTNGTRTIWKYSNSIAIKSQKKKKYE